MKKKITNREHNSLFSILSPRFSILCQTLGYLVSSHFEMGISLTFLRQQSKQLVRKMLRVSLLYLIYKPRQMHLLWNEELFFKIILQEVVGLLMKLVSALIVLN